jgi:hypothetical protein
LPKREKIALEIGLKHGGLPRKQMWIRAQYKGVPVARRIGV